MHLILVRVLHVATVMVLPPLMLGVITKTKAFFAGRVGAPLLQPYFDLLKLLRKHSIFSRTTTWVFRAGPVVGLGTALFATLLVPLGMEPGLISFQGDLILFAYLFALGRFFTILAALDTGSAFEGMGAAREATFSCLAEPALFFALLVLARSSGSLSLTGMMGAKMIAARSHAGASFVAAVLSLVIVLLVENCRIPFDDPNTHLELTMIHEVMVLDHGGPALGMILYGASIKLFVLSAIVARVALPYGGGSPAVGWVLFLLGLLLVAVVVGVIESVMARLRLTHVPGLLVAACIISAIGIALLGRS